MTQIPPSVQKILDEEFEEFCNDLRKASYKEDISKHMDKILMVLNGRIISMGQIRGLDEAKKRYPLLVPFMEEMRKIMQDDGAEIMKDGGAVTRAIKSFEENEALRKEMFEMIG